MSTVTKSENIIRACLKAKGYLAQHNFGKFANLSVLKSDLLAR